MVRRYGWLRTVFGLRSVLVLAAVTVAAVIPARAQVNPAQPVEITNIPLPVELRGRGSVSVVNTPTVDARQAGTWTVTGDPSNPLPTTPAVPFQGHLIEGGTGTVISPIPGLQNHERLLVTHITGELSCETTPGAIGVCNLRSIVITELDPFRRRVFAEPVRSVVQPSGSQISVLYHFNDPSFAVLDSDNAFAVASLAASASIRLR